MPISVNVVSTMENVSRHWKAIFLYAFIKEGTGCYEDARSHGVSINTWTVNDKEVMQMLIDMKFDQITADNPLALRKVIGSSGAKEKR